MLKKHEHSLITFVVVMLATLLGYGLYAVLIMAGFWAGREHNQAEMRYMKLKSINRDALGFFDGFRKEAWNYDSLVNDLVIPIAVGAVIFLIGVVL